MAGISRCVAVLQRAGIARVYCIVMLLCDGDNKLQKISKKLRKYIHDCVANPIVKPILGLTYYLS